MEEKLTWEIAAAVGWILLGILWIAFRYEHRRRTLAEAKYQNLRGHFVAALETPTPRRTRRALKARRSR